MTTLLITGATGNVGVSILKAMGTRSGRFRLLAGVRDKAYSKALPNAEPIHFDFEDVDSIANALEQTDILFLLRPPQISDVKKYFHPIMELAKEKEVRHIVFLSVQGADGSSWIPHHKIEKSILQSGINYTFLRPAYFMQNFTTTLQTELVEQDRIYLPAGKAKFTLIDVKDLGEVAASILTDVESHQNIAYDLTNDEPLSFQEMADILSDVLGRKITYKSPNLLSFYLKKRRENTPHMFILVMILLHYLPRFSATPQTSNWVQEITGNKPNTFREFVSENKNRLQSD